MVFLPHANTVILLEPYCATITEPGLPVIKAAFSVSQSAFFPRMKNLRTRKTSNGSNFDWLIRQLSINQKSGRQTFRRRFVSGSVFVSPCHPECCYKAKRKLSLTSGYHQLVPENVYRHSLWEYSKRFHCSFEWHLTPHMTLSWLSIETCIRRTPCTAFPECVHLIQVSLYFHFKNISYRQTSNKNKIVAWMDR